MNSYVFAFLSWYMIQPLSRVVVTSSFVIPTVERQTIRTLPLSRLSLHQLSFKDDMDSNKNSSSSSWTMQEEWALRDQIPQFTVGDENDCRTFWSQLAASTPLLSRRTETELYHHAVYLRKQQLQRQKHGQTENDDNSNNDNNNHRDDYTHDTIASFGPSPPVLEHWFIDSTLSNRISGQTLHDGRMIWMTYHVVGRLKGDPLADTSLGAGGVCNMLPGGYVEAVGGRVYELGHPQKTRTSARMVSTSMQPSLETQETSSSEKNERFTMNWWISASTATMTALLASTVLSAGIGYGAGLGIVSDGNYHPHPSTSLQHSATAATLPPTYSSSSIIYTPSTATSVTEQRARTEARVLRERRMIKTIGNRLEQDEIQLQKLRQQERLEYSNFRFQQLQEQQEYQQ